MQSEKMVPTFDETLLYYKMDPVNDPKANILIVHGLCEHLGRYDYVTERLNQHGYGVYRFDHRGHGKSEGKRVYFSNFGEIADDVGHMVGITLENEPDIPLYLLGHSMGGLAVALFGTKYPGRVDGFITSGALTRYNTPCAGELPLELPADTYLPNQLGSGVCSDPAVVEAYGEDPLVEKEISAGLLNTLWDGIQWLIQNPRNFTDPVLVLHGCNDGLVSEQDSREFFGEIGSEDKTLIIYARLFHEILNEPCRDEILADIVRWLDKRV